MQTFKKNNETYKSFAIFGIIAFILVITLWFSNLILPSLFFFEILPEEAGRFGDQFGAVNALFSGLAFAGILIALWMQRMDLNYQKDILNQSIIEMQNQIKESKEQTEQFRIQNKNMEIQKIESTFFNLLREYQNMINGIKYFGNLGRTSLFNFNNKLIDKYNSDYIKYQLKNHGNSIETQFKELFNISLGTDLNKLEFSVILRSFRAIMNYLEGIKNIEYEDKKKEYYLTFVRYISEYELIFLFIYGMMNENEDLRKVFNKYGLFRDFNNPLLTIYHNHPMINNLTARAFYADSAYE